MNLQRLPRGRHQRPPGAPGPGHPLIDLFVRTTLLIVAGGGLWALGRSLPAPPMRPADALDWLGGHGAAAGAVWLLLGGALLAVAHLLLLGVRSTAARIGGAPRLRIVLHHLPRRVGRRVVERSVGVSLAAGVAGALVPSTALADGPATPDEPTSPSTTVSIVGAPQEPALMVPLTPEHRAAVLAEPTGPATTDADQGPATATTDPRPTHEGADVPDDQEEPVHVTMRSLDADAPSPAPESSEPAGDDRGDVAVTEPATDPRPVPAPELPGTWPVERGDHLWSIAAETVTDALGTAEDTAVLDYWQRLITSNQERLVDPANPDLLFPGQVLVLPPVIAPG
jgi:nucleoid-associated protein YgaU